MRKTQSFRRKSEELQDQLKAMLTQMYGRRSEKFISDDQVTIADLGVNEAEYVLDTEGPAEEEVVEVKATRRRLTKKRTIDVSKLPVTVKEYTLSEDELQDKFPEGWKRFEDEVFRTLEYEPAKFSVTEHQIAVYRNREADEHKVVITTTVRPGLRRFLRTSSDISVGP